LFNLKLRLSYEMTHEAQSFLFADISSRFLIAELDGDDALVRPRARSKATDGTRLKQRWSQRSRSGAGVSQEKRGKWSGTHEGPLAEWKGPCACCFV
jgi:hypothetical protein